MCADPQAEFCPHRTRICGQCGKELTSARTKIIAIFCPHGAFMDFVWIWEQTEIISLYSINWLVFTTETECVYCAVRTGSLYTASLTFSNSTFCQISVFTCFVWIWEQTAIISLYNINWLVFIIETECVYCAVRTGSLYTASLTFSNSTFCPHSVFVFCVDLRTNSDYFPVQH